MFVIDLLLFDSLISPGSADRGDLHARRGLVGSGRAHLRNAGRWVALPRGGRGGGLWQYREWRSQVSAFFDDRRGGNHQKGMTLDITNIKGIFLASTSITFVKWVFFSFCEKIRKNGLAPENWTRRKLKSNPFSRQSAGTISWRRKCGLLSYRKL